jgi:uncharacterized protein
MIDVRTTTMRIAAVLGMTVALGLANVGSGQEGTAMQALLRPYLDPSYVAKDGPDTDSEFIAEGAKGIRDALPEKLSVPAARKYKVLVLTQGTYGTLHVPGAGGLLILLRESAAKHDAFELTELYSDESIDAGLLETFDVVVLNQVGRTRRPRVFNEILPEYVRDGGGLLAIHGSALLFVEEPAAEYNKLLGGYVDTVHTQYGHPTKQGRPFPILLPKPEHPLVSAFRGEPVPRSVTHRWLAGEVRKAYRVTIRPPAELADELYALVPAPGQQTPPEVLVRVDKGKAAQVYPKSSDDFAYAVTWVKRHGKGRVFYTQFGHNMAVFSVPCIARSVLDGLLYAASGADTEGAWPLRAPPATIPSSSASAGGAVGKATQ